MTLTAATITDLNFALTDAERQNFERDARGVPTERRAEAQRCWTIAQRLRFQVSVSINWQHLGGKSDEQIAALINAKVGQQKRSAGGKAGKKALEAKYGIEAADRIIANKKAGR